MIKKLSLYILLAFSSLVIAQDAEEATQSIQLHYVIDDLFVYMHAGPGREYRIVGSINAGTPVTVSQVDDSADYTEVEDDRGRTGWIESRFITDTPSIRTQLPTLENQLEDRDALIASREADISRLQQELMSIQDVEARLRQQINDMQVEKNQVEAQLQQTASAEQMDWFIKGGGVALCGVLLGVIVTAMFKQRKRDQWM